MSDALFPLSNKHIMIRNTASEIQRLVISHMKLNLGYGLLGKITLDIR